MWFLSEKSASLQTPLLEEDAVEDASQNLAGPAASESSGALSTAAAETPGPSSVGAMEPIFKRTRSRKMSLYRKQSDWSRRSDRSIYLDGLILQRQRSMDDVFHDQGQDVESGNVKAPAVKLSIEMHSAFVSRLRSYIADEDAVEIPSLEIRVKDFSFNVPIGQKEAEGKIQIPTVFNNSPIYWCKKQVEKLTKRRKIKTAIRKKQFRPVLSNINLSLEAGKMYLIIGPPSSGKTSLLNGK